MATLLSFAVAAGPAAQAPRPELAIKTEFVLRFPEFIEWPMGGSDGRIDGRVRFEIDLLRARRAGLKMDSQLLRLASKVYGGLP